MSKLTLGETVPEGQPLHALSPERIEISRQLFKFIASSLNKLHGTDFSERFWKMIAEEYSRSVIIRYHSFTRGPVDDAPAFLPNMTGKPANFKTRVRRQLANARNYMQSRKERRHLFETLRTHDQLLIDFGKDSLIAEETGGIPLPACSLKPALLGDREKRKVLLAMAADEMDLFRKNVLRQMPGFLVEHFGSIYDSIILSKPKQKTFHIRGKFNFSYRQIVLAKYAEQGSKMIWYQNGAMVGDCKYKYGGYLVRSVADEHRTWGWTMNGVDIPWRAYDLERFREQYEQSEKSGRDDLLITFPKLWSSEKFYIDIAEKLLESLDKERYRSIRIRPYPSWKSGSGAEKFQTIKDPRVTISGFEESMALEIAKSRIVAHIEVPATSFLESVSVDHPTTGLLMNEHPTDVIKPYYNGFLENGILHRDVGTLADQLNRPGLETWWWDVRESDMYSGFKSHFTGAVSIANIRSKAL